MFESLTFTKNILESFRYPVVHKIELEAFNIEYESCNFYIGKQQYKNRRAKKTPTKKGYFVVMWVKNENYKNRPYSWEESPEKLIVTVLDKDKKGQFVFPKEILLEKHIISKDKHKGKMAMRVYPSWETDLNKTARQTQIWQNKYFIDLTDTVDEFEFKKLYFS